MCVHVYRYIYKGNVINQFLLLFVWKDIYMHMWLAELYRGSIVQIYNGQNTTILMIRITTLPIYLDNWLNYIIQLHI